MAITIKSPEQIKLMRESGKILAETLDILKDMICPGVTTKELDRAAEKYIAKNRARPSFKGYRGFPASICASVNDEVIHGVPGLRTLNDGDIISIDIGVYKNGFHADAARTFPVGSASADALKLVEVTERSFFEGLKYAREGCRLYEITNAISDYIEARGYSVVRDWVGHGIGKILHEDPQIPHYRQKGKGPRLYSGMTLAIEPMVNAGSHEVYILDDEQTVVTADGKLSAHYENTVLITAGEPELLTPVNKNGAGAYGNI